MELVALVALLLLVQYFVFSMMCGIARVKGGVEAPACTGNEIFEKALRVQQNTLEQLMLVLPAMFICAAYFRADVAAICGAVFFIARWLYRAAYMTEPKKRAPGMMIGMLATVVLIVTSLWGVISKLL